MLTSLREPAKKIIGIFFLQKNSWKKYGLKWLKMASNAFQTQLIIFFFEKKVWKMTQTRPPIPQVWNFPHFFYGFRVINQKMVQNKEKVSEGLFKIHFKLFQVGRFIFSTLKGVGGGQRKC